MKFWSKDLFFWRSLPRCVVGPWPREGLSSEGCPWLWRRIFVCPWPRALCPRLHLCFVLYNGISFLMVSIFTLNHMTTKLKMKSHVGEKQESIENFNAGIS